MNSHKCACFVLSKSPNATPPPQRWPFLLCYKCVANMRQGWADFKVVLRIGRTIPEHFIYFHSLGQNQSGTYRVYASTILRLFLFVYSLYIAGQKIWLDLGKCDLFWYLLMYIGFFFQILRTRITEYECFDSNLKWLSHFLYTNRVVLMKILLCFSYYREFFSREKSTTIFIK